MKLLTYKKMFNSGKLFQSIYVFAFVILSFEANGQEKNCNCPPVNVYIYDTKINFSLDSDATAAEAGKYEEAKNSGDWLEGAFSKQQSDELKIFKGVRPGEQQGTTFELPPSENDHFTDVDFLSYATVSRSGTGSSASYFIKVKIEDAVNRTVAYQTSRTTSDLGQVDNLIDDCIQPFSPLLDHLRAYQEKLRSDADYEKWIYLKWKITVDKPHLKAGQSTLVHIKVFDCVDAHPAALKDIKLSLSDNTKGKLSTTKVITDKSGMATVSFKAGTKNGEVQVIPEIIFDQVNFKTASHATSCGDPSIIIGDNYRLTVTMEAKGHAANGAPLHCLVTGEQNIYCRQKDGTKCCSDWKNTVLNFKVRDLIFANQNGTLVYQSPKEFSCAFHLTLNICDKEPTFTLNFDDFGPEEEHFTTSSGQSLSLSHIISTLYQAILADLAIQRFKDFESKYSQAELEALAKRGNQHQNDAAYWKTEQGKKDKAVLDEVKKEFGSANGGYEMESMMTMIKAPFNKTNATPVNLTVNAKSLVDDSGGSGWDSGTIKVKLEKPAE